MTTSEIQAVSDRFTTFRKDIARISQIELAKETNTAQKVISFVETGRRVPNSNIVSELQKKYKLNAEWLWSGKGTPQTNDKVDPHSPANIQARLAKLETQIGSMQKTILQLIEKIEKS